MARARRGHAAAVRYTDGQCLAALRSAAAALDGVSLRVADYQRWRSEQVEAVPNDQVIRWRFGSWAEALEAAGLASTRVAYRSKGPRV